MISQPTRPQPEPGLPPAGWYQDPEGPGKRWWDGQHWTDFRQQAAQPAQPVQPGPPAQNAPPVPTALPGHAAPTVQAARAVEAAPPVPAMTPGKHGYILTRRVLVAYIVVVVCALLVAFMSLWGWWNDAHLATSFTQYAKPGPALIIFPLLVLAAMVPMGHRMGRVVSGWRVAGASGPVIVQRLQGPALRQLPRSERQQFGYRGAYWASLVVAAALWSAGLGLFFLALSQVGSGATYGRLTYSLGIAMVIGLVATLATWPIRTQAAVITGPRPAGT